MAIRGRVLKFEDNIDTDVMYPGKFLPILDRNEMAKHAFAGISEGWAKDNIRPGDIVVAGRNFGCGSSREQAATALKASGVVCIVAKSFSRIYFRNAINQGIPIIQSQDAPDVIRHHDEIEVDFEKGTIVAPAGTFSFPPLDNFVSGILREGGLIEYTIALLAKEGKGPKANPPQGMAV